MEYIIHVFGFLGMSSPNYEFNFSWSLRALHWNGGIRIGGWEEMEEGKKWWEKEENFLRKSSQALGKYESAPRLGVSFSFDFTLFL